MTYRFEFTDEIGDKVITLPKFSTAPTIVYDTRWIADVGADNLYFYINLMNADGTEKSLDCAPSQDSYLSGYYSLYSTSRFKKLYQPNNARYKITISAFNNSDPHTILATKQMYIRIEYADFNQNGVYDGYQYQ